MLKTKTYLMLCLLTLSLIPFVKAQNTQNTFLKRSTLGASGDSKIVVIDNLNYIYQQSINQSSVTGTFNKNQHVLLQGFIQPLVYANIFDAEIPLNLSVRLYPNPFTKNIFLSFKQKITGNIEVAVFDMLGKLIFSGSYLATQNLEIQLDDLSLGSYVLKIIANNRQFIENIIKGNFD